MVICQRVSWKNAVANSSCSRDILATFDALTFDDLPKTVGPFAAYVLISGAGTIPLSLVLLAPNGEIIVARDQIANNWGVIGTWEWVPHIGEFQLLEPGIYHWRVSHGDDVLLDRAMVVSLRIPNPVPSPDSD